VVFSALGIGEQVVLSRPRKLWGHRLYVAALRLESGDLLIVVSNRQAKQAISDYGKKWSIETLFGCLKTRGFCLESTHLVEPERLSRMIALLSIGLCWALRTGEWLAEQKPIEIKKHGRKARSIFHYGLDHLCRVLLNLEERETKLLQALQLLSSTWPIYTQFIPEKPKKASNFSRSTPRRLSRESAENPGNPIFTR
jgi:hypothetical protein